MHAWVKNWNVARSLDVAPSLSPALGRGRNIPLPRSLGAPGTRDSGPRRSRRLREAEVDRVADQPRKVADVESLHDLRPVRLHGLYADAQLLRDLAGGLALGEQP